MGNHERFQRDFISKNPQLESLLNFFMLSGAEDSGFNVYEEKSVVHIGEAKFIHGEMRNYGAAGDRDKKNAQVFDRNVIAGHRHNPSVRMGSYHIGLLGLLDQEYNEAEASSWMVGFGVVAHYDGLIFTSVITVVNYATFMNGDVISCDDDHDEWILPRFGSKVNYHEIDDE